MPVLVEVTKGLLTHEGEQEILPQISEALLRVHGLSGNRFMTPNVIGHVVVSEQSKSYVGGKPLSLAVVEVKVPGITFPTAEVKQAFVAAVTDLIDRYKAGSHPRERTFVNVTYAVDGAWGIGGKAYSNAELAAAVQQASAA
jgi:phenylpyruvate tautomerase PptA (4-oxalocrotonate tautomerase family)